MLTFFRTELYSQVWQFFKKMFHIVRHEIFPRNTRGISTNDLALLRNFVQTSPMLLPFTYRNPVIRQSIWQIKYKGHQQIANLYAQILSEEILNRVLELDIWNNITCPLIIPIPISAARRKQRGWSQTELVLKQLEFYISLDGFSIQSDILEKKRDTVSQTTLNRRQRLTNLKDSFCVGAPVDIIGRTIILFDDVITTGSTMSEAIHVLYKAGAQKVITLSLAY